MRQFVNVRKARLFRFLSRGVYRDRTFRLHRPVMNAENPYFEHTAEVL